MSALPGHSRGELGGSGQWDASWWPSVSGTTRFFQDVDRDVEDLLLIRAEPRGPAGVMLERSSPSTICENALPPTAVARRSGRR